MWTLPGIAIQSSLTCSPLGKLNERQNERTHTRTHARMNTCAHERTAYCKQIVPNHQFEQAFRCNKATVSSVREFALELNSFLVLSLLKYATKDSTLAEGVDTSQAPEKDLLEKEKATLKKLLPLVEKFVHEKSVLQVSWICQFVHPPSFFNL